MSPVLAPLTARSLVRSGIVLVALTFGVTLAVGAPAHADVVLSHQKISATEGNLGPLGDGNWFGIHMDAIGDWDGDGNLDIAVAAPGGHFHDYGPDRGAVEILLLNNDGTVKERLTIDESTIGVTLDDDDWFGYVAWLGDLDGDGVGDLAVGAPGDDDGGGSGHGRGAVWILFLNADATVKTYQKISSTDGGFTGILHDSDIFGLYVDAWPDLDGDDVPDLAVGSVWDDDGATDAGAVWILFLNTDGTVKGHQKISAIEGGFTGVLNRDDWFGHVSALEDLDNDGVPDLAVGAVGDDDGGFRSNRGAVWILFLYSDGTVKDYQKISSTQGGFQGSLVNGDAMGHPTSLPDLDGDGIQDLVVGAEGDDDGGAMSGALWILYLNSNGTVKDQQKISATQGGFTGGLDPDDRFGFSAAWLGDLNGDGRGDIAVGAPFDDDGGSHGSDSGCGAAWVLFLDPLATATPDVASLPGVAFSASPNPFRGEATFEYALPGPTTVRLSIFGPQGRRVATVVDRAQSSGLHTATWSGRDETGVPVGAGVYFAKLETDGRTAVRKIVVVK
jgi:hypothetical protein